MMPPKPSKRDRRAAARQPRRNTAAVWIAAIAVAAAFAVWTRSAADRPAPVPPADAPARFAYRVVNTYPHDPEAFTQGLIYRDGVLFESTGLHGRSTLRKVRLETGEVLQRHVVDPAYFAEGLTDWRDRLIQLTWQTNVGFVYDLATFTPQETFAYPGEGWGLTHDGARLIMSDGTASLRFLSPDTLRETGRLLVKDGDREIHNLNELEMVKGQVFANIWQGDEIAIIDPGSGRVAGWVDLRGILNEDPDRPVDVLNGIAYDAAGDRLFVTGKLWPKLFEISLVRR
jgi:glutaminyl-peptide cyclotransferase